MLRTTQPDVDIQASSADRSWMYAEPYTMLSVNLVTGPPIRVHVKFSINAPGRYTYYAQASQG